MRKQHFGVIPMQRKTHASETDELVADVAYTLWCSSHFRGGTPEQAFMAALRMVKGKFSGGPFLVCRRKQNVPPIVEMKSRRQVPQ